MRIEDGILITDSYGKGGDLYTRKQYGNFILRLEFMLSDVGNSGVFIRSNLDNRTNTGFEVQLLAPWTPWRDDLHCTASLYGHVAITNRPDETTGKWYEMEIICDRKDIAVSVNGEICTIGNMNEVVSLRNRNMAGHIGLQLNHAEKGGQWTKFRNISIRNLDNEPDYVARGLGNLDVEIRDQAHDAAMKMGLDIIGSLAFLMGENDPVSSAGAKQALFDICAKTSVPDIGKTEKTELISVLQKQAGSTNSEVVKNYLIWLIGMLE
ncbi:DUF1080 domain-containing protein [Bacteroidota bacterium]